MTDRTATVDVQIPTPQELARKYGPYLADPSLERPTEETPQFRHMRDDRQRRDAVSAAQAQWDAAQAERDRIAAWSAGLRAEREAKEAADRKAREDARRADQEAAHASLKDELRQKFLQIPGMLPEHWTPEREAAALDAYYARQLGVTDEDRARAEMARRYRTAI